MAVRTTVEDVKAIIYHRRGGASADDTVDFTPYIEVASVLTDKVESCAIAKGEPLTDEQLEKVERYLAAHFWGIDDQQYRSKQTERASATFGGETKMGLDFTAFGQMAKVLDTSQCLREMDRIRIKVGLTWLGKPTSGQIDYADRD